MDVWICDPLVDGMGARGDTESEEGLGKSSV